MLDTCRENVGVVVAGGLFCHTCRNDRDARPVGQAPSPRKKARNSMLPPTITILSRPMLAGSREIVGAF